MPVKRGERREVDRFVRGPGQHGNELVDFSKEERQ